MSSAVHIHPNSNPSGQTYCSTAPENPKAIASRAGSLAYFAVENKSAAVLYAFLYDGASEAGVLLHPPIPVPVNGMTRVDLLQGLFFKSGLFVGLSSTDNVYTALATSPAWIHARWAIRVNYNP